MQRQAANQMGSAMNGIVNFIPEDDRADLLSEYFFMFKSLNKQLALAGLSEIPLDAEAIGRISLDSKEQLKRHIEKLGEMVEVLTASVRVLGLHPSHFYLRSALKKFGWQIDADAFESLGERDTIEIYGADFSLKLANLRFIEVCSYSFDEVMRHQFFALFERDQLITQKLLEAAGKLFRGELKTTRDLGPDHVVRERFSKRRRSFWMKPQLATVVRSKSKAIEAILYSATVSVDGDSDYGVTV